MPKALMVLATFAILSVVVLVTASPATADPGLLLIAHGAPDPQWNRPVLEFGERVAAEARKNGPFKAVRAAMLELAQPDVPTAVAELEAAGCDRIVAVPLFVAPSGHTHFDVPAVLGVYSSPRTTATLVSEGVKAARPRVPIILTQTLAEGDLLREYALAEVRKLSKSPSDEAVVILAHGDPEHGLLVERLLRQVTTYCCGRTGISYGDWASVGVGQEYATQGVPTIEAALAHKKRVLVVGLYVSSTAAKIHRRAAKTRQGDTASRLFDGKDVVFSDEAIIAQRDLPRRVLDAAMAALSPATR